MRPRGLRAAWIKISNTYGCDKRAPSRAEELRVALKVEERANGPRLAAHSAASKQGEE